MHATSDASGITLAGPWQPQSDARHSPDIQLWLARCDGEVVSGNIIFCARQHVVYWLGATLEQHLTSGVANLLMSEIIEDAVRVRSPARDGMPRGRRYPCALAPR